MIVSDHTLRFYRPVEPFEERTKAFGLTYGLGPAGYDVRIAEDLWLPPQTPMKLASTMERFTMPHTLLGVVHDKSTWARRGLAVQNTVIEPGWCGFLTLELTNHGDQLLRLERGMPIAQIIFHLLDQPTSQPYNGKYQHQAAGPQPARDET